MSNPKTSRAKGLLTLVLITAVFTVASCDTRAPSDAVHVLTIDGTINGILKRYIDRGLDRAERDDAPAVVILINTPGGESVSMRQIVSRIETSDVTVITFVGPAGAQAASAGTFILMSGHIAAMAPSTTIGAATPVTYTGDDIEGALGQKIKNDTVAFARSLAESHGRNPDWAEAAVLEAASATPSEALEAGVIDLIAPSLPALIVSIEGRQVTLLSEKSVTLRVSGSELLFNDRNLYEQTLGIISDPLVVSILILVGIGGLAIEFFNPGLFLPAVVGITATIASFLGVGTLLPGEAAVAFLLLGVTLFVLEISVTSGGIVGSGGAVAIVLGLSILVGQGTTDTSVRNILTMIGLGTLSIALMTTAAFGLIARNYLSGTESNVQSASSTTTKPCSDA